MAVMTNKTTLKPAKIIWRTYSLETDTPSELIPEENIKITPILIIHGKGFRSENGIAVLKDLVEYYIATEGKPYIKYSADAPINLGGSGAKIIYLDI